MLDREEHAMPDEHRQIVVFLDDLRLIFTDLLDDRRELLPTEMCGLVEGAWPEIKAAISGAQEEMHKDATAKAARLDELGLTGKQWNVKITGFERARRRRKPKEPSGKRKWFLRIFGWANIILGSLANLLPGADAIKEYKESVEEGLKEADDEETNRER